MFRILIGLALCALVIGCTDKTGKSLEEPVANEKSGKKKKKKKKKKKLPFSGEDPCIVYDNLPESVPFYNSSGKFMVTRIMKSCVTRDGRSGYHEDSSWMAMGFPCTGSPGQIELKGRHYTSPRMVSFQFETGCGMFPSTKNEIATLMNQEYSLSEKNKLMAYTPFVLQYWEVPGYSDADTGVHLELRSKMAKDDGWKLLRQGEPLTVHLYGRENTWIRNTHLYFAEAKIRLTGQRQFQVEIVHSKPLGVEELEEVKARCEALKPRRACGQVF